MIAEAAIGGAAALGGAIYGAIASSKYNNKARALIQQQRDDNKRWFEIANARDFTQRTDSQAVLNRQREMLDEHYKRARAAGVVSGATDESVAMQKSAANDAMAQTMSDIASGAAAYKDSIEQQYRQQDAALNQQQVAGLQQQGQQAAQAGAQVANAGINLVGVGLQQPNYVPKKEA